MDKTKAEAARKGYTETFFGRRRYFDGIRSPIPYVRASAERMAINAPMQGTAADIIKRAMIRLAEQIDVDQLPVKMIMQVHDELVFEVKTSALDEVAELIRSTMEGAAILDVPLVVDVGTGRNWDEAH